MIKIKSIKGKEILDSRGNPTVEVELETARGKFIDSVPSGASKGGYEAVELRDSDGKGVKNAISNVNKTIAKALKGKEFSSQKEVDELLISLDGTENKSKLGVNAILPVSLAVCRAFAEEEKLPLFKYINKISGLSNEISLPKPCFNVIEGGAHAKNNLSLQEFMIIPQKKAFRDNLKTGSDAYEKLRVLVNSAQMGDEGGFAPDISKTEQALILITNAIANSDTKIGLDAAATQFFKEDSYIVDGSSLTRTGMIDYYKDLISRFPVVFIEDPFSENDWQGFQEIKKELNIDILGDDLLTTNIKRIKEAISKNACSGSIIKLNQIGTVSETLEAARLVRQAGWKLLVSHRSGETTDNFIADLAVGLGAEYIKAGAPVTQERIVKYNRLLEIESQI